AVLLLPAGLVLALCVLGSDPGDGGARVYPSGSPVGLLGPPGDWLGRSLHESLGVAVYGLLATWFAVVVSRFPGPGWVRPLARLVGGLLLLACGCVLADLAGPALLGGPVTGPGGSVGAWLSASLEEVLHSEGRVAVLVAAFLAGLCLAADFLVFGLFRGAWQSGALLSVSLARLVPVGKPGPTAWD